MRKMREYFAYKLLSVAAKIYGKDKVFPSIQNQRVKSWKLNHDVDKLRHQYDLFPESIVFDFGGYRGDWSAKIYELYGCNIFIFEPMKSYFENIVDRFKNIPKINIYNFGLASTDKIELLSVDEESSSIYGDGEKQEIKLVRGIDFLIKEEISNIDLMKINIEGAEYDLLEHLIANKFIHKVKNIQIQFHDFVPNANIRMVDICKTLSLTHELTYQEFFVWENWTLKDHNK